MQGTLIARTSMMLVSSLTIVVLAGCATAPKMSYTPPTPAQHSNSIVMPYGYDAAWKKLVAAASQTFYSIENYEKDSGLMTLSFGSTDISGLVDCGVMATNGKAENYISRSQNTGDSTIKLNGKMNLLVQPVSERSTRVTVNARYILNIHSQGNVYNAWTGQNQYYSSNNTWSFDSNSPGTITVQNPAQGISPRRTCQATGKAENDVINAIMDM